MKKRDIAVILVILLVAAGLYGLRFVPRMDMAGGYAVIEVNGVVHTRAKLSENQTIEITQESGVENVVQIIDNGVLMAHSTCDNQLCVMQGIVNADNFELRPMQGFIICLPNRVSVEYIPEAKP